MFYRARYYHPGIARFASRDPMGMANSISGYAYVANSPTNFTDSSGEFIVNAAGAVWGLVSGGISGGIAGYHTTGGTWTGAALGAVSGGLASAAVGAVNPYGTVAVGQIVGGTAGGILANMGNTALTQMANNQSVQPTQNLTWGTVGTSFLSGVAGAAGVGVVRMGATLVNAGATGTVAMVETIAGTSAARKSTALAINPTGNVVRGAGAVAGGAASGAMKVATAVEQPQFEALPGKQSIPGLANIPSQMYNFGYLGGGGGSVVLSK